MFSFIIFCAVYAFIAYATRLIVAYRFGFKDDIYSEGVDYVAGIVWPVAIVFVMVYTVGVAIAYVCTRKPLKRVHAFFVQHIGGRKIDV